MAKEENDMSKSAQVSVQYRSDALSEPERSSISLDRPTLASYTPTDEKIATANP